MPDFPAKLKKQSEIKWKKTSFFGWKLGGTLKLKIKEIITYMRGFNPSSIPRSFR
jgi:hypothetical protein